MSSSSLTSFSEWKFNVGIPYVQKQYAIQNFDHNVYRINVNDKFIHVCDLLSGDGKDNFKYGLTRLDLVNKFIIAVDVADVEGKSKSKRDAFNIIKCLYTSIVEDHTKEMAKATPSRAEIKKRKQLQQEAKKRKQLEEEIDRRNDEKREQTKTQWY